MHQNRKVTPRDGGYHSTALDDRGRSPQKFEEALHPGFLLKAVYIAAEDP
jgi:hypothetical protein